MSEIISINFIYQKKKKIQVWLLEENRSGDSLKNI